MRRMTATTHAPHSSLHFKGWYRGGGGAVERASVPNQPLRSSSTCAAHRSILAVYLVCHTCCWAETPSPKDDSNYRCVVNRLRGGPVACCPRGGLGCCAQVWSPRSWARPEGQIDPVGRPRTPLTHLLLHAPVAAWHSCLTLCSTQNGRLEYLDSYLVKEPRLAYGIIQGRATLNRMARTGKTQGSVTMWMEFLPNDFPTNAKDQVFQAVLHSRTCEDDAGAVFQDPYKCGSDGGFTEASAQRSSDSWSCCCGRSSRTAAN